MRAHGNYFKIGVFILSALTIMVVAIIVLGGGQWFKSTIHWETYFDESVQGLTVGAPIKFRGVQVGTVDHIDFVINEYGPVLSKEDQARYGRYVVVRGSAIPFILDLSEEEHKAMQARNIGAGLRVRLASQGVTGVVFLEANYFDPLEYPALELPWEPRAAYVPSATSTVTMLGTALHKIARGLERADFHKITLKLEALLLHVEKLVEETNLPVLTGQAGQTLAEFHETAQKIRELVESPEIQTITAEGARRVQETRPLIAELSQASKQIKIVSDQFPDTFARLERTVQRIDRLVSHHSQDVEEMVENLRTVSENLRELTDKAKQYPAQVLFGDPPPRGEARTR